MSDLPYRDPIDLRDVIARIDKSPAETESCTPRLASSTAILGF